MRRRKHRKDLPKKRNSRRRESMTWWCRQDCRANRMAARVALLREEEPLPYRPRNHALWEAA